MTATAPHPPAPRTRTERGDGNDERQKATGPDHFDSALMERGAQAPLALQTAKAVGRILRRRPTPAEWVPGASVFGPSERHAAKATVKAEGDGVGGLMR